MQEYFIDTGAWKDFWARWQNAVDSIPGLREKLLERIGTQIQNKVRQNIDASGLNDARGRVKRWQNPHMGTKRRYVAVRPDSVEVPAGYKDRERLNAGALTNFLASGHRVRGPSGKAERYEPRARMTRVRGYDFYKQARGQAEKIALQEAEAFLKELPL